MIQNNTILHKTNCELHGAILFNSCIWFTDFVNCFLREGGNQRLHTHSTMRKCNSLLVMPTASH